MALLKKFDLRTSSIFDKMKAHPSLLFVKNAFSATTIPRQSTNWAQWVCLAMSMPATSVSGVMLSIFMVAVCPV